MNIVDSSGWLEYLAGSSNASNYAASIEDNENLLVPTIIVYEVQKKLLTEGKDDLASKALILHEQGRIVTIDQEIAILASRLSIKYKLPLADSIIYAVAKRHNAILWTQDEHFEGLPNVRYFTKQ